MSIFIAHPSLFYRLVRLLFKIVFVLIIQHILLYPGFKYFNLCYIYTTILIYLPAKKNTVIYNMLFAFILGLYLDIVNKSTGSFALSAIILIYTRHLLCNFFFTRLNYSKGVNIGIRTCGFILIAILIVTPVLCHNVSIFVLEMPTLYLDSILNAIYKVSFSTIITSIACFFLAFDYR